MDYDKINKIDIDGNENIVLQDINGSTITVNYNDAKAIKEILQNINNSQTIELKQIIAKQNKEVLIEIRKIQGQIEKQNTEDKIDEYMADLNNFFNEIKMFKINAAKKRILKDYSILHQYEDMLILEDDPIRKERYKSQIETIKENITNGEIELKLIAKEK